MGQKLLFLFFFYVLTAFVTPDKGYYNLVVVEGGKFKMGSKGDNKIAELDEQKQHEVEVNSFMISKVEIAVWEWRAFCKATKREMPLKPQWGWHDHNPITNVTWFDAIAYCNWLSKRDGLEPAYEWYGPNVICNFESKGYRLPTEAEWEFAARGGKKSKGFTFSGSQKFDDIAWHIKNSKKQPHTVGTKLPNELGIHDMSGNVWEWCWDWYNKDYYKIEDGVNPKGPLMGEKKTVRGGSWDSQVDYLRSANRISTVPNRTNEFYGFRIARSI